MMEEKKWVRDRQRSRRRAQSRNKLTQSWLVNFPARSTVVRRGQVVRVVAPWLREVRGGGKVLQLSTLMTTFTKKVARKQKRGLRTALVLKEDLRKSSL